MDSKHLILAVLAIAGVLGSAVGFNSWRSAHDDMIRAQATITVKDQSITDASKREADRDANLRDALSSIAELKEKIQTPAQAAIAIPKEINSSLPQPITINVPPANAPPNTPATASVPIEDLKPLNDLVLECQACQKKIPVLEADLADEQLKLSSMTAERDVLKTAAKGTIWTRAKRAIHWLAIGALSGAVAVCMSGHCR